MCHKVHILAHLIKQDFVRLNAMQPDLFFYWPRLPLSDSVLWTDFL